MKSIANIYHELDALQRKFWFHIAASVVALAACAGFFGSLLVATQALYSQREAIVEALSTQNINRGDPLAVSLRDTGEIFVNGRHYGGPAFRNPPIPLFDADGNILAPRQLADALLDPQRPAWAPDWMLENPGTTWMLALVFTAWLALIVWMDITVPFLFTLIGTAIPAVLCWQLEKPQAALAFAGIGLLTFTFVLLTRAAMIALHYPWQPLAVAHTVIKEASRTGLPLVFIVVLLAALPLLPLSLNEDSPLRFQMQTFISRSLGLTFGVAAMMTLMLACSSVAFEIRDRQIWQLMTKPTGRLNYLIGKWLGVMLINVIILAVCGVSTFTFIQYLSDRPVARGEAGVMDAMAVRDEVLTARVGAPPDYFRLPPDQMRQQVEQVIRDNPTYAEMDHVPLAERMRIQRDIEQVVSMGQRTVPPGPTNARAYIFRGLREAKQLNSTLTLRYRFHILRDDEHLTFPAVFTFYDPAGKIVGYRQSTYVPTMAHSFPIGTDLIQDDGTLRVSITNLHRMSEDETQRVLTSGSRMVGALNFEEADFELLYKVGNFEGNFFRAMLMMWIKLAFLAAFAVCCATFLSFPVAWLLSFTVFLAGMLGPFLAQALKWYYPPETDKMDWGNIALVLVWAFEWCTRSIALALVFLLSSFGEYRPTESLVEGRLIEWSSILTGAFRLVLLWSGLSLLIGWIVLRKRQLAIYSGQG